MNLLYIDSVHVHVLNNVPSVLQQNYDSADREI